MEWCEELANATVVLATQDYINASRNYHKCIKQAEKAKENPEVLIRKPNETERCFKARQYRHNAKTYENRSAEYKVVIDGLRQFFTGRWFGQLTSIDGKELLNQLDKQLEKEGHKV